MIRKSPLGSNWIGNGGDGLTLPKTGWKFVKDWIGNNFEEKTKDLEDSFTVRFNHKMN